MIQRYTFLLTTLCLLAAVQCSIDAISGTTSSENAKVLGTIVTESGDGAPNTLVKIIPRNYNPVVDGALTLPFIDTTDNDGNYLFTMTEKGIFNIEALHLSQRSRLLITGITVDDDSVFVPTGTLTRTGALRVFLPDTVDTVAGYAYIEGTSYITDLGSGTYYTGNHYTIIIDSVPFGNLPPLILASKDISLPLLTISNTITALPDDTVDVGADTLQQPIWHFPLIVGVTKQSSDHYNGFDSIKTKIIDQMKRINSYFNDPKVFDGIINFRVDSIYEFTGSVVEEVRVPIGAFAMRLIYDGDGLPYLAYWRINNRSLYLPKDLAGGDDFFTDNSTRSIVWGLGLARGCPGQYQLQVTGASNPINGEEYQGLESIMNAPSKYTDWDTYSINIINHYNKIYSTLPEIVNDAFPSYMGVHVTDNAGQALKDATVELFGVKWGSYAVTDTSILSGTSDSTGIFKFHTNPYALGDINKYELVYSNFLVRATNSSDTAFTWLPITEVGSAWFINPDTLYLKEIQF